MHNKWCGTLLQVDAIESMMPKFEKHIMMKIGWELS